MLVPLLVGMMTIVWSPLVLAPTSQRVGVKHVGVKEDVQKIEFREFFEAGEQELKPSPKLVRLNGERGRLVGFMAHVEEMPEGAFYLCPHPVYGDESGGGTADLPVETVRVIVRSAKGKKIPFIGRAIEVTGILEVGNRAEDDGTV